MVLKTNICENWYDFLYSGLLPILEHHLVLTVGTYTNFGQSKTTSHTS